MSGTGVAEWDQLNAVATKIEGFQPQFDGILSSLQNSIQELAAQWQSTASSAFQSAQMTWSEDTQKVNQALMDIATGIRNTASAYQTMTEDSTVKQS